LKTSLFKLFPKSLYSITKSYRYFRIFQRFFRCAFGPTEAAFPLTTLSVKADFAADSVESSHILGVSASLRVTIEITMRQWDDRWLNWQTEHKLAIKQPESL